MILSLSSVLLNVAEKPRWPVMSAALMRPDRVTLWPNHQTSKTAPDRLANATGPCPSGDLWVSLLFIYMAQYTWVTVTYSLSICVFCVFYHHPCSESKASSCLKRTPSLSQLFSLQFKTVLSSTVWIYGWHCVVQTNVVLNVPFKVKAWKVASLIYNYGVQPDPKMHGWEIFFAQRKVLFPMWRLTTCEHMHPLHV